MSVFKLAQVDIDSNENLLLVPAIDYVKADTMLEAKNKFDEKGHDTNTYHIIQMPSTFTWEHAMNKMNRSGGNKRLLID